MVQITLCSYPRIPMCVRPLLQEFVLCKVPSIFHYKPSPRLLCTIKMGLVGFTLLEKHLNKAPKLVTCGLAI